MFSQYSLFITYHGRNEELLTRIHIMMTVKWRVDVRRNSWHDARQTFHDMLSDVSRVWGIDKM